MRIDAAYPFAAPHSVTPLTVQNASGASEGAVALGVGGGIIVLSGVDGATPSPQVFHSGGPGANPEGLVARSLGRARESRVLDDSLWVAAGDRGLLRYDFTSAPELDPLPVETAFSSLGGHTLCLATLSNSTHRRVFAGTVESDGLGKLWMIDPVAGTSASISMPAGIESIEAYAYTPGTGATTFRVLVGTRCAGIRVFDVAAPYTQLPASPVSTTGGTGHFVRDLQLHVVDATTQRVYAALHEMTPSSFYGVYGYRIEGNGTLTPYTDGWPIRPVVGVPGPTPPKVLTDRLALDRVSSRLVIGMGSPVATYANYSGFCDAPLACGCVPTPPFTPPCDPGNEQAGIAAYTIGPEPSATVSALEAWYDLADVPDPNDPLHPIPQDMSCRDLAIRRVSATEYFVDVAADNKAYRLVRGTRNAAGVWTLAPEPHYGKEHGLALHTFDTLRQQNGMLYVGSEVGLVTFDSNLPLPGGASPGTLTDVLQPAEGEALEEYRDYDYLTDVEVKDFGILGLSGFDDPNGRVFAASHAGVALFNIQQRRKFDPVRVTADLETLGRSFFCETAPAVHCPPIAYPEDRFLYVSHISPGPGTTHPTSSGFVSVFNVKTFGANPAADPNAACVLLDEYIHDQDSPNPKAALGGMVIVPTVENGESVHYVLVAYGPKTGGETHVGVVVLKLHCSSSPSGYELQYVTKVQASSPTAACVECTQPGLITYDADSPGKPRLYVAFLCNGLGIYDATNLAQLQLESWRPPAPASSESFFQVLRGPDNTATNPPTYRLVVSAVMRGVGILETTDFAAIGIGTQYPITFHDLPVDVAQIQYADETKSSFWAAGLRDGLLRFKLQFPGGQ